MASNPENSRKKKLDDFAKDFYTNVLTAKVDKKKPIVPLVKYYKGLVGTDDKPGMRAKYEEARKAKDADFTYEAFLKDLSAHLTAQFTMSTQLLTKHGNAYFTPKKGGAFDKKKKK